ncbi:MAG: heparinase II/III family protein [Pseudomonadota bacterium]
MAWPLASFRKTVKEMMLRSFWEHAHHLMDHQGHPNNWMVVESAALTLAGMCLPEFQEAEAWLETGILRLKNEFIRQFMDDGTHYELSPLRALPPGFYLAGLQ